MTGECSLLNVPDGAGPHPVALVVVILQFSINHTQAAGGSHSGSPRLHFATRWHPHYPPSPRNTAFASPPFLIAKSNITRHKKTSVGGDLRAERIFVIMTRKGPCIHGFINVGP